MGGLSNFSREKNKILLTAASPLGHPKSNEKYQKYENKAGKKDSTKMPPIVEGVSESGKEIQLEKNTVTRPKEGVKIPITLA